MSELTLTEVKITNSGYLKININCLGTVPTVADLPTTDLSVNDTYLVSEDGLYYTFDGDEWCSCGGTGVFPSGGGGGSTDINEIMDKMYPIGSIYMSVNNVNPSTLFGGTWVPWGSGRVPVGVNADDTNFSSVEKTGGASTHTLTTEQLPSHTHTFTGTEVTSGNQSANHTHTFSHTHGISAQTVNTTEDTHNHKQTISNSTTAGSGTGIGGSQFSGSSTSNLSTSSDTHKHSVTIPAHNTSSQSTTKTGSNSADHNHKVTAKGSNSNTGSGESHNNLQPYITCYMWKRTA